jgi:hypothetical protein
MSGLNDKYLASKLGYGVVQAITTAKTNVLAFNQTTSATSPPPAFSWLISLMVDQDSWVVQQNVYQLNFRGGAGVTQGFYLKANTYIPVLLTEQDSMLWAMPATTNGNMYISRLDVAAQKKPDPGASGGSDWTSYSGMTYYFDNSV